MRKPRINVRVFPRIEVEDNKIWMQVCPHGRWKKVPLQRARYIRSRLTRAIKHVKYRRKGEVL